MRPLATAETLRKQGRGSQPIRPTKTMTTTASTERIVSALAGRTIRYYANDSQQTADGVRVFKIDEVTRVTHSRKGVRFITARVWDIDDRGEQKFRSLHLNGIDLVV